MPSQPAPRRGRERDMVCLGQKHSDQIEETLTAIVDTPVEFGRVETERGQPVKSSRRFMSVAMFWAVLTGGCAERGAPLQIQVEPLHSDDRAASEGAARGEPVYPIETAPLAKEQSVEGDEPFTPQAAAPPRDSAADEAAARSRESAEQAERRAGELDAELRAAHQQIKELDRRLRKQQDLIEDLRDEAARARRDRDRYREKYEREKRRRRD